MDLNVLYFAHVRSIVGKSQESLTVPCSATVGTAVAAVVERYPPLATLMASIRIAVNGEFVDLDHVLTAGDELVLIPPVAGGSATPRVALTAEPLDAQRRRALEALVMTDRDGALVHFVGAVRDHARGRSVTRLFYEAYESMAQKQLEAIVDEVEAAFPDSRMAVQHRTGMLSVGDVAVIVVAAAPHRAEAFGACRMLIDRLKQDVPIWKREIGPDGEEWVSDRP